MRVVYLISIIVILAGMAFLFFVYLGIYDIGATNPQTRWVRWVFDTVMDNSVRRKAADITVPPLDDVNLYRIGAGYYESSCALCHGMPGAPRPALAKGLNPAPPDLADAVKLRTAAETFWIVRNGIRMSGMAAFSHSYDDGQLWTLVAFLERLPSLSPEEYRGLVKDEDSPSK